MADEHHRRDRIKCDGTNPRCRKRAVSDDWRINNDVAWKWHGSWRERRGIHVFISFAMSPERAGLFESTFWHHTVMLACYNNEAVFHVCSAIGALHEHIFKRFTARGSSDSSGMAFALRQCNRSIKLLTDASAAGWNGSTYSDPGIALITCVLFAVFESLNGDPEQAITHSLQGRKLLQNCERLTSVGHGSKFVDPMSIRPIMGGLEIQAKAIQGKMMQESDITGEPPLPDVSRLHSLEHANWTLHYVYISILVFCQDCRLDVNPYELSVKMAEKYLSFAPWLKVWEASFADFLFRESSSLSAHDMQRAKVLKANHIGATLLATIDHGSGCAAWEPYDNDCRAIIDLSASVLTTYTLNPGATLSKFQFPFLCFALWVAEPLFIVMSRCCNPEVRRQAAGLLTGQPRANHAQKLMVRQKGKSYGVLANALPIQRPRDTDGWNLERWIDFAMSTRLDAGMATYFARLPSEYIDKPVYNTRCP